MIDNRLGIGIGLTLGVEAEVVVVAGLLELRFCWEGFLGGDLGVRGELCVGGVGALVKGVVGAAGEGVLAAAGGRFDLEMGGVWTGT